MKIIFCLHHFLPEYIAGTEIYTLRLAQSLKISGVDVVILIPGFDIPVTTEYINEGIRVIRHAENSLEDREMIMGKKAPGGLQEFADIMIKERPDIVHFHELAPGRGTNIFHVEKTHSLNIPIILTFHLSYYTCIKNSLYYKNIKKCDGIIMVKRCTECVYDEKNIKGLPGKFLSNTAAALFKLNINTTSWNNPAGTALGFPFVIKKLKDNLFRLSTLAEKIVVIAQWYKEILEKNEIPSSKLVYIKQGLTSEYSAPLVHESIDYPLKVVYIGRITSTKGLHLLIDTVCRLPHDKISLHIYGKESESDYVNECKKRSACSNNISWKGVIASKNVIPTLSGYDLLCLPSIFSEMSPLVIQEAFAAGIPVLVSTVYGNIEQVIPGTDGWLFRFNDREDLFEKMLYLINNLHEVEQARHHLPPSNSFSQVAESHLHLYTETINNKKTNYNNAGINKLFT